MTQYVWEVRGYKDGASTLLEEYPVEAETVNIRLPLPLTNSYTSFTIVRVDVQPPQPKVASKELLAAISDALGVFAVGSNLSDFPANTDNLAKLLSNEGWTITEE